MTEQLVEPPTPPAWEPPEAIRRDQPTGLTVSVVVPTINESGNVQPLVDRLSTALRGVSHEIIFVDDSEDDTPQVISAVARAASTPVRLIHRPAGQREGGLSGAVVQGLRGSSAPWVVVMDGDLQHPPEVVPQLLAAGAFESADVVVASRYTDTGDASGLADGVRRAVSSGSTAVTKMLFPRRLRGCSDPMTGFFAVRRAAVTVDALRPRGFKILLEILARQPLRVAEVPFTFAERHAGESKASLREGLRFGRQLVDLRFGRLGPFALVGAAGAVLNLALLALLLSVGVHYTMAAMIAAEITIVTNFLMQDRLVFRGERIGRRIWHRALQSFAFNNAEALVRLPLLVLLVEQLSVPAVPAQALTLVIAFGARYTFISRFVYRPTRPVRTAAESHAVPPPDDEKYAYLAGRQARWLFPLQTVAFVGVAVSLAGFATNSYWTLVFLLPLSLYAVEQLLALRTSTYRRRVTLPDHLAIVELWQPARYPSVDVFLPTAGESLDLLANTYDHVRALQWPGQLRVYVLDDSERDSVRALAAQYGFTYLARRSRQFKKAGNLRYGFDHSKGELIAIFDADFVPRPDYLRELVPYFDEPTVGIVQSPQYFSTSKDMSGLERAAGATQEMFYRLIQPSRDAVGAAICVGTCAIYRRSALAESGGFPQIGHSEDVYTGVAMGRAGYELQYVPVLVSRGVCPDGINTFITQQYRWCEGSMSLMVDPAFHTEPSMTLRQRLCFWSGFLYYLSTAITVFLAPLPVLVMAIWFPGNVFAINMLPLVGALLLWFAVYPLLFKARWRIEVLRVQALYSFAHALSILHLIRGVTTDWVPSHGADRSRASSVASTVRTTFTTYLLATQLALLVVLTLRTHQYGLDHYWATIAFALINGYVFAPLAWTGLVGILEERAAASPTTLVATAAA